MYPDVNECEKNPCPVGSRCVNTKGSFTCECPLGFDLEDGRSCTRGKTLNYAGMPHCSKIFVCLIHILFCFTDSTFLPSIAKTFLGIFSVNRLPHDPVTLKSATMHEIQREIIQLVRGGSHRCIFFSVFMWIISDTWYLLLPSLQLNASLSVLRGYSRSILSQK